MEQNRPSSLSLSKLLLPAVLVLGFLSAFAGGFILSEMLITERVQGSGGEAVAVTPSPVSKPTVGIIPEITGEESQETTKFLPGKHYFEDTAILISKNKPRQALVATVVRSEQESGYSQTARVSYFDGNKWRRVFDTKKIPDSTVVGGGLVRNWTINIDPSRILKQKVSGELNIDGIQVSFSSEALENEIGMRSLPGYTKFLSSGNAVLHNNGESRPSYILYTRVYSLNAAELQLYDQSLGLTTDWVAFWDEEGNFFHADATKVDKPTSIYQSHQIGIIKNTDGSVSKTFNLNINRGSKSPPEDYVISMIYPVPVTLNFRRVNGINKAPNSSYIWHMGIIEGTVVRGKILNGVGLVEYIKD